MTLQTKYISQVLPVCVLVKFEIVTSLEIIGQAG